MRPRRLLALLLAALLALTVGACAPRDDRLRPDGALRLAYGADSARQFGDLYLPPHHPREEPLPLVILVHGGGWAADSDLSSMGGMAGSLLKAGVGVWNIEYRGAPGEGGWPQTYLDIAQAVDTLPAIVAAEGYELDEAHLAIAGYSAGGNLAAWAASRGQFPPDMPGANPGLIPPTAVLMAGVYDLAKAHREGDHFVDTLLGGTPAQVPSHYRMASPINYLPQDVRVVVYHGRNDTVVPVGQAELLGSVTQAAGNPAELHLLDNASHVSWFKMTGPQWAQVKASLLTAVGK